MLRETECRGYGALYRLCALPAISPDFQNHFTTIPQINQNGVSNGGGENELKKMKGKKLEK